MLFLKYDELLTTSSKRMLATQQALLDHTCGATHLRHYVIRMLKLVTGSKQLVMFQIINKNYLCNKFRILLNG